MNNVFDMVDTSIVPDALCMSWKTAAAMPTIRGGITVASMAILREFVAVFLGHSTHAMKPMTKINGMITIIVNPYVADLFYHVLLVYMVANAGGIIGINVFT